VWVDPDAEPIEPGRRDRRRRWQIQTQEMGRGFAWLDTGTPDNLLEAAEFVRVLEKRQGFHIICCPEEIAFHPGWINVGQLEVLGKPIAKSAYGPYLLRVARLDNLLRQSH
jgi:glucose-1-phosphate thymidylyltransferase